MLKILAALLLTFSAQAEEACWLASPMQEITSTKKSFAAFWKLDDAPILHSSIFEKTEADLAYENWVRSSHDYDPIGMMRHHRQLIADSDWIPAEEKRQKLAQFDLVISWMPELLREITCLEMYLHRLHNMLFPLQRRPSEFYSVVLKKGEKLKIYIHSEVNDYVGSGPGPTKPLIEKDLKNGWRLFKHIHNHPFNFDNPYGSFGPIAPSDPDIKLYEKLRPDEAIITNGIESFVLRPEEYLNL